MVVMTEENDRHLVHAASLKTLHEIRGEKSSIPQLPRRATAPMFSVDTPTSYRLKRGHKRSSSDVTNLRFSRIQTSPNGLIKNEDNINKQSSFLSGLAYKIKTALGSKQEECSHQRAKSSICMPTYDNISVENELEVKVAPIGRNSIPKDFKTLDTISVPVVPHCPTSGRQDSVEGLQRLSYCSNSSSGSDLLPPTASRRRTLSSHRYSDPKIERMRISPVMTGYEVDRSHNDVTFENMTSSLPKTSKSNDVNLLVIGAEKVGKSALIVRYLTKRFIGEYASNVESVYDQTMPIDGKDVNVHIWESGIPTILQKPSEPADAIDELPNHELRETLSVMSLSSVTSSRSSTSSSHGSRLSTSSIEEQVVKIFEPTDKITTLDGDGRSARRKKQRTRARREDENNNGTSALCTPGNGIYKRLNWSDGVVVVYSICDVESFESARDVVRYLRGHYVRGHAVSDLGEFRNDYTSNEISSTNSRISRLPILLIGNKCDLEHRRRVEYCTLHAFACEYACTAVELSVPDGYDSVIRAFNRIVDLIRKNKTATKRTRIKSIVRSVSVNFGHRRNISM